jgi:hypothetical protein
MGARTRQARARRLLSLAVAVVVLSAVPAGAAAPAWTITASPNPVGTQQTYLDGIACTGPATSIRCFAVGSYVSAAGTVRTLIERWNGTSWVILPSPNRAGAIANALVGVTCASSTSCFAVGNSQATPTSPAITLVERWNGIAWTIVPSPNGPGASGSFLHAVSCVGPNRCFAVGSYKSGSTAGSTLIERWTGSAWVISPSPNKPDSAVNDLDGVSCVALGAGVSCMAVGSYSASPTGDVFFTLTERWGPAGWAVVPSPNVGGRYKSALNAVSCTSATFCMAVGAWSHAPGASLAEKWNGKAWTITPVSNFPGWTFSQLNGISCVNAANCFAVGSWAISSPTTTLVAHWNGTGWVPIASPSPTGSRGSTLTGVACIGTRCLAAGSAQMPPTKASATLTERNY